MEILYSGIPIPNYEYINYKNQLVCIWSFDFWRNNSKQFPNDFNMFVCIHFTFIFFVIFYTLCTLFKDD